MNSFYDLAAGVAELVALAKRGEEESAGVTVRRMKDIVRRMGDSVVYSPAQMSVVFSELMKLPSTLGNDLDCLNTIVRQLRSIFGEYHPVLGDLCETITLVLICYVCVTGGCYLP
jgi:hypothetical protein